MTSVVRVSSLVRSTGFPTASASPSHSPPPALAASGSPLSSFGAFVAGSSSLEAAGGSGSLDVVDVDAGASAGDDAPPQAARLSTTKRAGKRGARVMAAILRQSTQGLLEERGPSILSRVFQVPVFGAGAPKTNTNKIRLTEAEARAIKSDARNVFCRQALRGARRIRLLVRGSSLASCIGCAAGLSRP